MSKITIVVSEAGTEENVPLVDYAGQDQINISSEILNLEKKLCLKPEDILLITASDYQKLKPEGAMIQIANKVKLPTSFLKF